MNTVEVVKITLVTGKYYFVNLTVEQWITYHKDTKGPYIPIINILERTGEMKGELYYDSNDDLVFDEFTKYIHKKAIIEFSEYR